MPMQNQFQVWWSSVSWIIGYVCTYYCYCVLWIWSTSCCYDEKHHIEFMYCYYMDKLHEGIRKVLNKMFKDILLWSYKTTHFSL